MEKESPTQGKKKGSQNTKKERKKTVKIPKRKGKRQTPLQDKKSKKEKRKKDYEVIKFIRKYPGFQGMRTLFLVNKTPVHMTYLNIPILLTCME